MLALRDWLFVSTTCGVYMWNGEAGSWRGMRRVCSIARGVAYSM
jgi:hypothetical protein